MLAGGFFRARMVRRVVSTVAALMALFGGLLVLIAAAGRGLSSAILPLILGLGALFGAWWIHNGGKALLFPRARLTMSGLITAVIGVLICALGFGVDGLLVIAGGVAAWLATIL